MISFKQFLVESAKQYKFDIKIAGEVTDEQMEALEVALDKWGVASISKPKRTPIQRNPVDFPNLITEVSVMEVILNYPTTPTELQQAIVDAAHIAADHVKAYHEGDPIEQEHEEEAAAEENAPYKPVLTSDYPKSDKNLPYGDKFNKQFLKDLEKMPKMKIAGGSTSKAQTTNDLPQGKMSPVGSTKVQKPTADKVV